MLDKPCPPGLYSMYSNQIAIAITAHSATPYRRVKLTTQDNRTTEQVVQDLNATLTIHTNRQTEILAQIGEASLAGNTETAIELAIELAKVNEGLKETQAELAQAQVAEYGAAIAATASSVIAPLQAAGVTKVHIDLAKLAEGDAKAVHLVGLMGVSRKASGKSLSSGVRGRWVVVHPDGTHEVAKDFCHREATDEIREKSAFEKGHWPSVAKQILKQGGYAGYELEKVGAEQAQDTADAA